MSYSAIATVFFLAAGSGWRENVAGGGKRGINGHRQLPHCRPPLIAMLLSTLASSAGYATNRAMPLIGRGNGPRERIRRELKLSSCISGWPMKAAPYQHPRLQLWSLSGRTWIDHSPRPTRLHGGASTRTVAAAVVTAAANKAAIILEVTAAVPTPSKTVAAAAAAAEAAATTTAAAGATTTTLPPRPRWCARSIKIGAYDYYMGED